MQSVFHPARLRTWLWPEVRYWLVRILCGLHITGWYHPFRPYDFERAVTDKIKPLFPNGA